MAEVQRNPLPYTITGTVTRTAAQVQLKASRPALLGHSRRASKILAHSGVTGRFISNDTFGSGGLLYYSIDCVQIDGQRYADVATAVGEDEIADGVSTDGLRDCISNSLVHQFWGTAIVLRHDQFCWNNIVGSSFVGIEAVASDIWIIGNEIAGCRDWGLATSGSTSNVLGIGNHSYGHTHALHCEATGAYRGVADTIADSSYGGWIASPGTSLLGVLIQQNYTAGVIFGAPGCRLDCSKVYVGKSVTQSELSNITYGVILNSSADFSQIWGCEIELADFIKGEPNAHTASNVGAVAIQNAADQVKISCSIHDNATQDGSIGIELIGAVKGCLIDITTKGFHGTNDRIIKSTNAGVKCIRGRVAGENIDTANLAKYFDFASGWDGTIEVINTTTGATATITGPTAV